MIEALNLSAENRGKCAKDPSNFAKLSAGVGGHDGPRPPFTEGVIVVCGRPVNKIDISLRIKYIKGTAGPFSSAPLKAFLTLMCLSRGYVFSGI